ncbi:hypothetical protein QR680_016582 [Steinernema hermaphroditum]|uniref:Histone deacetylase n=1 Tax=Steinernema hermaphroditum TaxID=289476 RepID=A0AA39HBM8_9BILA|nr:hypothetical protein QR680_016582 [Steinernema hermaphroditum]
MPRKDQISYFYHPNIGRFNYNRDHPMKPVRLAAVHDLVTRFGLQEHMTCVESPLASATDMKRFHTSEYIDFLRTVTPRRATLYKDQISEFNLNVDSPLVSGIFDFCSMYTGGTIAAAQRLNRKESEIAINWSGGLHHAKRSAASGFCYVNDIVIGIIELLKRHERVLYIDIDVHHGDGVEQAFANTDRVMTLSFHQYGRFFFPESGCMYDVGHGKGQFYAVNVPLKPGIDDACYHALFKPIVRKAIEAYDPMVIVMQCGADSLQDDELGGFNLTIDGHAECVRFVKGFCIPMLVLGGGGYTPNNVAKCWTYETAVLIEKEQAIPRQIPAESEYAAFFHPDYELRTINAERIEDLNTVQYMNAIRIFTESNLSLVKGPPSVQMRPIVEDYYDNDEIAKMYIG